MRLSITTSSDFIDNTGKTWLINCSLDKPCFKEHLDKVVAVTLDAYNRFSRMGAYHFWIRLNEGMTITEFTNMLKKNYNLVKNSIMAYIRVKEHDEGSNHVHYHFMLYADIQNAHWSRLGHLLHNHCGREKYLMNYGVVKWDYTDKRPCKIVRTEQDLEDVIHRASYLAKTRSKLVGAHKVSISTSRHK